MIILMEQIKLFLDAFKYSFQDGLMAYSQALNQAKLYVGDQPEQPWSTTAKRDKKLEPKHDLKLEKR